jgi:protein-disulfide isomerase
LKPSVAAIRSSALLPLLAILLVACAKAPDEAALDRRIEAAVDARLEARLSESAILDVVRKHPEVLIESVTAYRKDQQERAQAELSSAIRRAVAAIPQAELIGDSPRLGEGERPVTLIEFSDFQCPFCARAQATIGAFLRAHGAKVALVYKHLPLTDLHAEALNAALASWAAGRQGRFWEYHDRLFAEQSRLGEAFYVETAKALALDLQRFDADRRSPEARAAIERDVAVARRIGVDSTPWFLMNGVPIAGAEPLEKFEAALAELEPAATP